MVVSRTNNAKNAFLTDAMQIGLTPNQKISLRAVRLKSNLRKSNLRKEEKIGIATSAIFLRFVLAVTTFVALGYYLGIEHALMNSLNDLPLLVDLSAKPPPVLRQQHTDDRSLLTTTAAPKTLVTTAAPKTKQWPNWPAVAHEEVGHALVTKGDSFFNQARDIYFEKQPNGKMLIDEFVEVYKNRPDPVNLCGIRINHALALFLAVKRIQPSLVVESGVNAGVSTYFIRAASPTTKIFAIDPLAEPICAQGERWIDPSDKTVNYTGKNFVDLLELDWFGMISRKEIDVDKTLVFIDDHLHTYKRIAGVMRYGVRHIVVEDNYKLGKGATQNDRRSTPKQIFGGSQYKNEADWLFNNMIAYAEFPPIVPPIMAKEYFGPRKKAGGFMVADDKNTDIVAPMLRPDLDKDDMKFYLDIAKTLGIDPSLKDKESYMQFMNYNQICHLELLAMPQWNLEVWKDH